MRTSIFGLLLVLCLSLDGQTIGYATSEKGDSLFFETDTLLKTERGQVNNVDSIVLGLQEEKDSNIDLLIQDYVSNKKFMGYRIQIFSSNVRWEAVKVRSEFVKKYPKEKSYLVYHAPNFKVRIGNYLNRLITHEHLDPIKMNFPESFIVQSEIEPSFD